METLFLPYKDYSTLHIVLEITAVVFALFSVFYSKNNNIKVYPTGIISTFILIYLTYQWNLFGDMIISGYYFVMSVYGWYLWSNKTGNNTVLPISKTNNPEYRTSFIIFIFTTIFVAGVYLLFDKFGFWWSYVDIFTTGLFFIGMWLLAKRKLENWIFLVVGNIISIPLYYFKGYALMAILYVVLTVVGILGYLNWKKIWNKENQTL